jgi:phosphohistidine swiveling domain-containing protein
MIGDLFNYGHLKSLEKARKVSDLHVCGVITDEVAQKWTSPLVCSYEERKAVIERIEYVDETWRQDSLDPTQNLMILHRKYPDAKILLMQSHHLWQGSLGSDFIEKIGGDIVRTDFYQSLSRDYMVKVFFNFFMEQKGRTSQSFADLRIADVSFFKEPFSTKANTLQNLRTVLKNAEIEKLFVFTVRQWKGSKRDILAGIEERFRDKLIVVRSSSLAEDALESSNAGHFHSELNVDASVRKAVATAIERVAASFGNASTASDEDQILIQEQTENVALSGVVFTRNLETNTPYYLINYDDISSRTDTVTSGSAGGKLEILRSISLAGLERKWRPLLAAIHEIENFFQGISLDIEFAIRTDNSVVIFQVRPLAANSKFYSLADDKLLAQIERCKRFYQGLSTDHNLTNPPLLSDMAFWNPAELIGDRPEYLAYSIFNHLIMKGPWNEALLPLGYAEVSGGLMVRIANKPYILVAKAFRSLLPASIPHEMAQQLVDYYLNKLQRHPELHDKVEFEIVHNCYTFDLEQQVTELYRHGFSQADVSTLTAALKYQTMEIVKNFDGIVARDTRAIKDLELEYNYLVELLSKESSWHDRLRIGRALLEDCRKKGIPAFVRAARLAFISSSFLRSLCREGLLTAEDVSCFMNSVETVTTDFDHDVDLLVTGLLDVEFFLNKYGHLRPGTYDITKSTYRNNPSYLRVSSGNCREISKTDACFPGRSLVEIESVISAACKARSLPFDGAYLLRFMKSSIQLREYFKFIYTKNISLALEIIAMVGGEFGFSRTELAKLDYSSVFNALDLSDREELTDTWRSLILGRREDEHLNSLVSLPAIIMDSNDFMLVKHRTATPNFVTEMIVEGEILALDNLAAGGDEIRGKIVVIEKADPGYDWIFTKGIAGLITKYGGAASHMAIRTAEFGIPAAIGCGEVIFSKILMARRIIMDCKNRTVHPLGGVLF